MASTSLQPGMEEEEEDGEIPQLPVIVPGDGAGEHGHLSRP